MTSHRATVLLALTLLEGCSLVVSGDRADLGTGADDAASGPLDGGQNSSVTESATDDGKSPMSSDAAVGVASEGGASAPGQATDGGDDAMVLHDQRDASQHDASIPPPPACAEVAGMKMARIETPAGGYCIDVHEVSQRQYWAFLDATPDLATLYRSKGCAGVRDVSAPWRAGKEDHPVEAVSYCGAEAYCSFVGKSLCGDIGTGGTLDTSLTNNALHDMWWRACSGDNHRAYPYGEAYAPASCNGEGSLDTTPVGSLPQCVTPEQAVSDLSGNVWEWTNVCNQDLNTGDYCLVRGGSYQSTPDELSCSFTLLWAPRAQVQPGIGFRCCSR